MKSKKITRCSRCLCPECGKLECPTRTQCVSARKCIPVVTCKSFRVLRTKKDEVCAFKLAGILHHIATEGLSTHKKCNTFSEFIKEEEIMEKEFTVTHEACYKEVLVYVMFNTTLPFSIKVSADQACCAEVCPWKGPANKETDVLKCYLFDDCLSDTCDSAHEQDRCDRCKKMFPVVQLKKENKR